MSKRSKVSIVLAVLIAALAAITFVVVKRARNHEASFEEAAPAVGPVEIDIQIVKPVNLIGRESLTRGLEHFDDALENHLKRMSQALHNLLDKIPYDDAHKTSTIRLNGSQTALGVRGAPIDHPLFDWRPFKHAPQPLEVKVTHLANRADRKKGLHLYQVRLSSASEGEITIEVTPLRDNTNDTCRVNEQMSRLFANDRNGVSLDWALDVVAACILSDVIVGDLRHKQPERRFSEIYDLFFETRDAKTLTEMLEGAERYQFFATQWQERPEEAMRALRDAITHFKNGAGKLEEEAAAAGDGSYPLARYLYAHALTSAVLGPLGSTGDASFISSLKSAEKTAFAAPPFECALWSKAVSLEATVGDQEAQGTTSEDVLSAWKNVVENTSVAAPHTARPCRERTKRYTTLDKPKAGAAASPEAVRALIKARTRLLLALQRSTSARRAKSTSDAQVGTDIDVQRAALDGDIDKLEVNGLSLMKGGFLPSDDPDDKLTRYVLAHPDEVIENALTRAGYDLDMSAYYITAAFETESLRNTAHLTANLVWTAKSGLDDVRKNVEQKDRDLCGATPAFPDDKLSRCLGESAACAELRQSVDTYLKSARDWLWAAAARKLARASVASRSARWAICAVLGGRDKIAECEDAPRLPDGKKVKKLLESERERVAISNVRLLDNIEAALDVVTGIFGCHTLDTAVVSDCSGATPDEPGSPLTAGADARQRRWSQQARYVTARSDMRATCAVRRAALTTKSGEAATRTGRYSALLDEWLGDPPALAEVRRHQLNLRKSVGADAYQSLHTQRALFSYAAAWPAVRSYSAWHSKKIEAKAIAEKASRALDKEHWNEANIRSSLLDIFHGVFGDGAAEAFANVGEALRMGEELKTGVDVNDSAPELAYLIQCRSQDPISPPKPCILHDALDVYQRWGDERARPINAGAYDPDKCKEMINEAYHRSVAARNEVLARTNGAYNAVVHTFLADARRALNTARDEKHPSDVIQSLRVAFFRVVVAKGSLVKPSGAIEPLALRVFVDILADDADMRALAPFAEADPIQYLSKKLGIFFTHGDKDEEVKSLAEAEKLTSGVCAEPRALREFLSYASVHQELYRASSLADTHPARAMNLSDNLRRWCSRRGIEVLSKMIVLGDRIRDDWGGDFEGKEKDPVSRVARVMASDDFPQYAYARFLLKRGDSQGALEIARRLEHVEAKILTARALLGAAATNQAMLAQAAAASASAARSVEIPCSADRQRAAKGDCGEGLILDGAVYRTLGDAMLEVGHVGGMGATHSDKGPNPEYYEAARAYAKAISRSGVEEIEQRFPGLSLRLAAAHLELGNDDEAARIAGEERGRSCQKARLIRTMARWARGELDVVRDIKSSEDSLGFFDLVNPSDNSACSSDKARISLGARGKALRQLLLRERAKAPTQEAQGSR